MTTNSVIFPAPLPPADGNPFELALPIVGIAIGFALLIGVIMVLRKHFKEPNGTDPSSGFALGGLRELVRQGKMTQEEYDQAKAGIVAAAHRQAAKAAEEKARDQTPQPPFSVS